MFKEEKVVFLDLEEIARKVIEDNDLTEMDDRLDDLWDLFWPCQEYGTDCYVCLATSYDWLEEDEAELLDAEECGTDHEVQACRLRYLIRKFVADNLPEGACAMVPIQY